MRISQIRKTRVDLWETYSTFSESPLLLSLIIISVAFTNFVISLYINLFFFDGPVVVRSMTSDTLYIGISTSLFTLGVIVFSTIGGMFFHRVSVRWMIMAAIAITTVSSMLTGLARDLPELLALRFLMGLGNGILQGNVTAVLGGVNPGRRGLTISLKGIAFSGGLLAGPYTASAFFPHFTGAFLLAGISGVVSIAMLYFLMPDIRMNIAEHGRSAWSKLFNRNTVLLFAAILMFGVGLFGFLSYYSHYLIDYLGISSSQSATVSSFLGIGGFILTLPFAMFSDRVGRKASLVLLFSALLVASALIFATSDYYILLLAMSFIFGGAYNGLINIVSAAAQEWAHPDAIATASGAIFSFYYLGGIIGGPLLGALYAATTFRIAGLATVAMFMLFGLILSFLVSGKSPSG